MRKNRFYYPDLTKDASFVLTDPALLKQLVNVLRVKKGDSIYLFDGRGSEAKVEISQIAKNEIVVGVLENQNFAELKPKVNLYLASLKKENFELAVQKAVEAGVSNIVPVITEHTVKLGLKADRLAVIIKEATEQSGRVFLPTISEPQKFEQVLSALGDGSLKIFFDLADSETKSEIAKISVAEEINLFIGPEGGWSDQERIWARENKFIFYQLGDSTLRAETAAIVATWLAVNKRL